MEKRENPKTEHGFFRIRLKVSIEFLKERLEGLLKEKSYRWVSHKDRLGEWTRVVVGPRREGRWFGPLQGEMRTKYLFATSERVSKGRLLIPLGPARVRGQMRSS